MFAVWEVKPFSRGELSTYWLSVETEYSMSNEWGELKQFKDLHLMPPVWGLKQIKICTWCKLVEDCHS